MTSRFPLILAVAVAATGLAYSPASAQIITTILPLETPGGRPRAAAGHLMAGYATWEYGTDFYDGIVIEQHGGTLDGAYRGGAIFAADFPFKLSRNVSMTVGGWFNQAGERVAHDPEHSFRPEVGAPPILVPDRVLTERTQYSSVYASVFYKWFGVQAGVVPVRINQTLEVATSGTTTLNRTQTDFDVFGVVRFTERESLFVPVSFTFGVGAYRYSARAAGLVEEGLTEVGTPSPASTAPSAFGNISVELTKHLAFDFSVWATGANSTRLSDSQSRATFGLGITF